MNKGMKTYFKSFLSLLFLTQTLFAANDITGFWKTVNEQGVVQSIIAIYDYDGKAYGRIIASFDSSTGKIKDSVYNPVEKAPGIVGNPPYCGLDIICDLEDSGWVHKGKIIDPEHGKTYKAELWTEAGDLVVRGKLLMFGRSQKWFAVKPSDLNGFKLPDPKSFIPKVPKTN